jgi:hypothetical protein
MHSRAKPLFFSFFTNRATQVRFLAIDYFTENPSSTAETPRAPRKPLYALALDL